MPRKRSDVWSDERIEELKKLVETKYSARSVLLGLGLVASGANYRMLRIRIKELALSNDHWTGQGHLRNKTHDWSSSKTSLEDILSGKVIYNPTISKFKERLFRAGVFSRQCAECGITSWREKPISLHLEHIDGNTENNKLDNLKILCPNCHSQTATHCRSKDSISLRPDINLEELFRTKTVKEIADITGRCVDTVRSWRRKHNY